MSVFSSASSPAASSSEWYRSILSSSARSSSSLGAVRETLSQVSRSSLAERSSSWLTSSWMASRAVGSGRVRRAESRKVVVSIWMTGCGAGTAVSGVSSSRIPEASRP